MNERRVSGVNWFKHETVLISFMPAFHPVPASCDFFLPRAIDLLHFVSMSIDRNGCHQVMTCGPLSLSETTSVAGT